MNNFLAGRVVKVGGQPLLVRAADVQSAVGVALHLGHLPALQCSADLLLVVRRGRGHSPATEPRRTGTIELWDEGRGGSYVARDVESQVVLTVADGRAELIGPARSPGFRPLLQAGVARLLVEEGQVVLHGGLIAMDDGAVLVLGPSGAGKSTVCYAAWCGGYQLLGDDLAVVSGQGNTVRAGGVARLPAVDAALPDTKSLPLLPDDRRGRRTLPPEAMSGATLRVQAVVLPRHGQMAGLTRADLSERERLVFASALLWGGAASGRTELAFPVLAGLAQLPHYVLHLARDEGQRVAGALSAICDLRAALRSVPPSQPL